MQTLSGDPIQIYTKFLQNELNCKKNEVDCKKRIRLKNPIIKDLLVMQPYKTGYISTTLSFILAFHILSLLYKYRYFILTK